MIELPKLAEIQLGVRRILRPASKLGKIALWFGGLALVLEVWKLLARAASGTMLSVWATITSYVFVVCLALLGMRYVRQKLLWRLRNRLIVTYVFIGVIPIVLLVAMVLLAGYLFAGQFATYVALADLDAELQHLTAANDALAAQFVALTQSGKLTPQLAAEISSATDEAFSKRTVTVLEGDRGFVIEPGGKAVEVHGGLPDGAKKNLTKFVVDGGRLHLRAVRHENAGSRRLTVISSVPMTPEFLQRAARVGSVEISAPDKDEVKLDNAASSPSQNTIPPQPQDSVTIDLGGPRSKVVVGGKDVASPQHSVEAGKVLPAANSFDPEFRWGTLFSSMDWKSGKERTHTIVVGTRPSVLYNVLFGTLGTKAGIFIELLLGIAVFFGIIELISLIHRCAPHTQHDEIGS